jgi:Uma2 family endonuclease
MSLQDRALERLDFAAFIARCAERDVRYELYDGEAYAMAGGSPEHGALMGNAYAALRALFRSRGCEVFVSDVYVRAEDDDYNAMLPDVFVRCGPRPPGGPRYLSDPVLIVEVLSPSTMDFDRGEKLRRYKAMASVQHVMLIYQGEARVEVFSRPVDEAGAERDEDDRVVWETAAVSGPTGDIPLPRLDAVLSLADIYDGVAFAR